MASSVICLQGSWQADSGAFVVSGTTAPDGCAVITDGEDYAALAANVEDAVRVALELGDDEVVVPVLVEVNK